MAGQGVEILRFVRIGTHMIQAGMAKEGTAGTWIVRYMHPSVDDVPLDGHIMHEVLNPFVVPGFMMLAASHVAIFAAVGTNGDLGFIREISSVAPSIV